MYLSIQTFLTKPELIRSNNKIMISSRNWPQIWINTCNCSHWIKMCNISAHKKVWAIFYLRPNGSPPPLPNWFWSKSKNLTAVAATPPLYPIQGDNSPLLGISFAITPGVLRTPSVLAGSGSTKVNRAFGPASCFYWFWPTASADSSKLSYTSTLSYTTNTILPGLG